MRYRITRTSFNASGPHPTESPTTNAVSTQHEYTIARRWGQPTYSEHEAKELWIRFCDEFKHGRNLRADGDLYYCEVDLNKWYIDISSLEELSALAKTNEDGFILFEDDGEMVIEIYDSYRE